MDAQPASSEKASMIVLVTGQLIVRQLPFLRPPSPLFEQSTATLPLDVLQHDERPTDRWIETFIADGRRSESAQFLPNVSFSSRRNWLLCVCLQSSRPSFSFLSVYRAIVVGREQGID